MRWRQMKAEGPVEGVALKWNVPEPEPEETTEAAAEVGAAEAGAEAEAEVGAAEAAPAESA